MDTSGAIDHSRQKEKAKPLVLVAWRDILSDDGWTRAKDVSCPTFYSVGWLAYEDEDTIKIASTLDYDDAFDDAKAAGAGSIVQLSAGEFFIDLIEVREFHGSLIGAGKGKTVISTVPDLNVDDFLNQNLNTVLLGFVGGDGLLNG